MWRGSKNKSFLFVFRMCLSLNNHLNTGYCILRVFYVNFVATTNPTPIIDIHREKINKNKAKHNTTETHQSQRKIKRGKNTKTTRKLLTKWQ